MNVITFFIFLAFLATIFILFAGGVSMARGGKFDQLHADEFMWGRIVLQTITLGLMFIAMLFWT